MKLVTLENDPDNSWSMNNALRHAGYHCRGYYSIDALLESPWAAESDLAIIDSDGLDKGLLAYLAQTLSPALPMVFVGSDERRPGGLAREEDAYLPRPVSARGLVACVKSTLSRAWD